MKILIFVLCCILILILNVQEICSQQKQDSLIRVLNSSLSDTARIKILNELSETFRNVDYKTSLSYGEEGLNQATKIHYKKGIANSLTSIGLAHYREREYIKSREFLDKSYLILEELKDNTGLANYHIAVGDIYSQQQSYESSLSHYNQSLEISQKIKNTKGIIRAHNSIGYTYYIQEKYGKAMEYYLISLNRAESNGNNLEIANCYINIANVLNAQADYGKSIQYLKKSLLVFKKLGDKNRMAVCYNNIAAGLIYLDSLKQSIDYLEKAMQIHRELNDKKGQAACYLNMGIVSDKNEEYKKAVDNYLSALTINELLKDKYRVAGCLANLTTSYLKLEEYDAVINFSERGLKIANEINGYDIRRIFYLNLSATYDSLKNYNKAYEYFKLFKQVDDSLSNAEKRKQVLEMEAKYQSVNKEKEISNLTKDNKLQAIQLEKNRDFQIYLIVVSILVLILVFVFYRLYKLKLHSTKILAKKNDELELMNKTLSDSESSLKELNATKDKFFAIIAHDIKNPLSAYRSITKMLSHSFYELGEQEKLQHIMGIYKSSENLYDLFQNLLQWSTSQSGSMKFKPHEIDLGILAYKALTVLQESADKKNIQVEMNIETGTYAYGDINMVSTVIVNLLSNAIKYTNTGGFIKVIASHENNYTKISIADNGIGIATEDIGKLFRVEVDHKTIGNSAEKGTGIGLILCKEFVSKNGGEIWVESEYGKGSTFHFTLPGQPG